MVVQVLGFPYDASSSFARGAALAPAQIRAALHSGSANYSTELGASVDPADRGWADRGDVSVVDVPELAIQQIRDAVSEAAEHGPVLSLGGDHFITWPIVNALAPVVDARFAAPLTILHVDAHPDLYDELDGDRYSHACPFARIMEDHPATRLVQLGIRTANQHQREQAARFGVEMIELHQWDHTVPELTGPVYVSIDLDGLDPAFAPGVSHHEPGGLSTRQLLNALHQLAPGQRANPDRDAFIVGADIVEYNPSRDVNGVTAMVAAKLTRELMGLIATP